MLFLYKLVFVYILSSVPDGIGVFSPVPEARCVPEAPAVTAPCSTSCLYVLCVYPCVYMCCVFLLVFICATSFKCDQTTPHTEQGS